MMLTIWTLVSLAACTPKMLSRRQDQLAQDNFATFDTLSNSQPPSRTAFGNGPSTPARWVTDQTAPLFDSSTRPFKSNGPPNPASDITLYVYDPNSSDSSSNQGNSFQGRRVPRRPFTHKFNGATFVLGPIETRHGVGNQGTSTSPNGSGNIKNPNGSGNINNPGTPATPSGNEQIDALNTHNTARAAVGSVNLTWDSTLSSDAMTYAQVLANQGCNLIHDTQNNEGENLYEMSGSDVGPGSNNPTPSMSTGILDWISEGYTGSLNHYTQVVWHSTTNVGCAGVFGNGGSCRVIVCRYSPPGNFVGESPFAK